MSVEQRLAVLENQTKRIQVLQNNNAIYSRKLKDFERKLEQTVIDEDKYKSRIEALESENEILRRRVEVMENTPKAKMILINERTDEVDELRAENDKIKEDFNGLVENHRKLIASVDSKFADFRGKYVPFLDNLKQQRQSRDFLRNRRRR